MRKRSKYRPKPQYPNPLAAVLEKLAPAREHGTYLLDLRIKNHGAMAALMQGQATKEDITTLMAMSNMTEALMRRGHGKGYEAIQQAGYEAVRAVAKRFKNTGRATLYAAEIAALNDYLELHNAQMDVVCVDDVDKAIAQVRKDEAAGRIERICQDSGVPA